MFEEKSLLQIPEPQEQKALKAVKKWANKS